MTPWVGRLLVLNALVFLLTSGNPTIDNYLAFSPPHVLRFPMLAYTAFTYMFVHAGFMHIFFNMLMLFFFGPRVEAYLGSKRFIRLYLISGFGGAALSVIFFTAAPIVGASGAVFGVMLAFAMLWPRDPVYLMGVIPIPAAVLVGGMALLALFGGFGRAQDGIAHFAHLGGFVGAWFYMSLVKRSSPAAIAQREQQREIRAVVQNAEQDIARWEAIAVENLHEVNREEVERLLEKVSSQGVTSLSRDERAFLDSFGMRA